MKHNVVLHHILGYVTCTHIVAADAVVVIVFALCSFFCFCLQLHIVVMYRAFARHGSCLFLQQFHLNNITTFLLNINSFFLSLQIACGFCCHIGPCSLLLAAHFLYMYAHCSHHRHRKAISLGDMFVTIFPSI